MKYSQDNFAGGMNLLGLDTQLEANQYRLLINGRTRFGYIEPIKSPLKLSTPSGTKRGLFAAGSILVAIIDQYAYYKLETSSTWVQVSGFVLSTLTGDVFGALVPISFSNFVRKAKSITDIESGVTLEASVQTGSPAGLIIQDGVSQPWIIQSDGTARVLSDYTAWNETTNREYVPIGIQMAYHNGKLYIVAPDGKSIYHSVSGRPLDFVVNITTAGVKGGNATTTSFAVDFNVINLIQPLDNATLIVGTSYSIYAVTPDYTVKIFGEPKFTIQWLFNAGIINQYSLTSILGDLAFIDFEGIKSFNAVQQLQNEGNNSVFSKNVARLFNGIKQDVCCATNFNNYALFAVKTIYGYITIIYDTLSQTFTGIDLTAAGGIRQFAAIYTNAIQKLYAITVNNEIYEIEGGSSYEIPILQTRGYYHKNANTVEDLIVEQKAEELRLILEESTATGTLYATEYVDNRVSGSQQVKTIENRVSGITYPIEPPVVANSADTIQDISIPIRQGRTGRKLHYIIRWTNNAKLSTIQIMSKEVAKVATEQRAKTYVA